MSQNPVELLLQENNRLLNLLIAETKKFNATLGAIAQGLGTMSAAQVTQIEELVKQEETLTGIAKDLTRIAIGTRRALEAEGRAVEV